MPCEYSIDLERRWVICRAWDIVTYDEALSNRKNFTSDPRFSPDFYQLYDATEVTRLTFTASEVGLLAKDRVFSPGARQALVAPRRETYNFGQTFQLYRQINSGREQIRLFRTVEQAEAWLQGVEGIPIATPPRA